jgi:hypothetical protein
MITIVEHSLPCQTPSICQSQRIEQFNPPMLGRCTLLASLKASWPSATRICYPEANNHLCRHGRTVHFCRAPSFTCQAPMRSSCAMAGACPVLRRCSLLSWPVQHTLVLFRLLHSYHSTHLSTVGRLRRVVCSSIQGRPRTSQVQWAT